MRPYTRLTSPSHKGLSKGLLLNRKSFSYHLAPPLNKRSDFNLLKRFMKSYSVPRSYVIHEEDTFWFLDMPLTRLPIASTILPFKLWDLCLDLRSDFPAKADGSSSKSISWQESYIIEYRSPLLLLPCTVGVEMAKTIAVSSCTTVEIPSPDHSSLFLVSVWNKTAFSLTSVRLDPKKPILYQLMTARIQSGKQFHCLNGIGIIRQIQTKTVLSWISYSIIPTSSMRDTWGWRSQSFNLALSPILS